MSDQSSKFIKEFIKENTEQFSKYKKYISNNDWSRAQTVDDEGNADLKYKTNEFSLQNDLILNVVDQLKFFVEKETDHLKPQFKTFVKFSLDIIDIHRQRVNKYVKSIDISNIESQDIRSGEVKFLKECFEKINKVNNTVSLLNIKDESNKGDGIQFFKNQKATIPMIKTLALYNSTIRDIVEGMELPTEITDLTFYIHRDIKEVPVWIDTKNFWEQDRDTFLFWYNEWLKINIGFTIDGYFFHPWLYYHLNFYKTPIPINGLEDIMNPSFRDNEYYIAEILKEAEARKNVGVLLYGSRRIGKALRDDQILHYTDGTQRPIGNSKIGDKIFGSDGKETTILGVYPQGVLKTYKVDFADGRISYCCEDHLWTVFDYQAKVYKTLPLKELLREGYSYERKRLWKGKDEISTLYKYYIPICKAVEYTHNTNIILDPYYLGVWLGDGTSLSTAITTIDKEIKDWAKEFAKLEGVTYSEETKKGTEAVTIKLTTQAGKKNPLLNKLKNYSLISNKHIPKEYLEASVDIRMELLRGLMDTDGTISKLGGDISIGLASERLSLDILQLCRSLGIACNFLYKKGKYIKKSGELNDVYKVTLFTNKDIFKLSRKLNRVDKNPVPSRLSKMERVAIISITEDKDTSATCIRVDNKSKEFLTNDFIVTHNSVGMSSICEWKALIKDNASTAITSGSAGDLAELTHKINTSMKFKVPAFQLLIQKQEWDGGTVELGLKWDASTLIEHSRHTIKNLSGGAKTSTQKGAGGAPSVYLIEEIGKFPWEKSYLAAQPSFETPDGYKTTVILVGTSGEASLSGDAMRAVSNPNSFKLLEMNWDLLESKMPASAITWKRRTFANFVPAQMAYKSGFKRIQVPFGKFLGIKSEQLDKVIINQTDWENNTRILLEDRERVKLDALKYQQECVQYPIDPTDCFLSANKNPFPYKEAQLRKQYLLESGEWDRRRTIFKTAEGKIGTEHSSLPMAEYPHKGGTLDAPIMIYEDIPIEKPVDNLYIASFDDVKQDDSDTDSLICFQIWKMSTFADEWGGRLVVSWTCRPDDRKPMYEKWLLLQQAYNAMAFPENEDMGYKTFLEAKHLEDKWLIPAIDFTSNMGINSNNKRKFGWMPRQSKKVLLGLLKEKLHNPYVIGEDEDGELITIKEVSLINDITYLDEIINYNEEANVDRISASLGAIGWMHYLESNWILPVSMRKIDPTVQKKPHVKRIFGGSRGRSMLG